MKIGFAFLIYDKIENTPIWKAYLRNHDYEICIHAKDKSNIDPFFLPHCIDTIPTRYRHISITKVKTLLLEKMFENTDVSCVILLSGSCFPVVSYSKLEQSLENNPISRIGDFTFNRNNHIHERSTQLKDPIIDKYHFKKQQETCIIMRSEYNKFKKHISYIIDQFKDVNSPEEHLFINMFEYYNIPYNNNVVCMPHKQMIMTQAKNIDILNEEYINIAKKRNAFFIRKITNNTNIHVNIEELLNIQL